MNLHVSTANPRAKTHSSPLGRPKLLLMILSVIVLVVMIAPPSASHAQTTPAGRLVMVVDGEVRVLNLADNSQTTLEVTNVSSEVILSPDGSQFVTMSREPNNTIFTVFDSASYAVLHTFSVPANYSQFIGWSPDGNWIAAGTPNNGVLVIRLSDGLLVSTLPSLTSDNIIWLSDNRILLWLGTIGFPFFVIDPANSDPTSQEILEDVDAVMTFAGILPLDMYGLVMSDLGYTIAAPQFYRHSAALQPDLSSISIQLYPTVQLCSPWVISQNIRVDMEATPDPEAEPTDLRGQIELYRAEAHALSHLSVLDTGLLFVQWEIAACAPDGEAKGRLLLVNAAGEQTQIATDIRRLSPRIDSLMPGGRPYAVSGDENEIAFVQATIVPNTDPEVEATQYQQTVAIYNRTELTTTTVVTFDPGVVVYDLIWLP